MGRYKTFEATGVAPNGKVYAGDLNAIQDMKTDLTDLTQVLSVGTLRVGETGLAFTRAGAGLAALSGALQASGRLTAAQGVLPGPLTSAARDGLASGTRPKGMAIFNSDTNSWEYNAGTDAAPSWQPLVSGAAPGGTAGGDLTGSFPNPQIAAGVIQNADVNAAAGIAYTKLALTGSIVNTDLAAAAAIAISKLAGYPTDGSKFLAGDGTWKVAASGAPSGAAGGDLAGSTYPNPAIAPLAVGTSKIADGAVTSAKIADGTIVNADIADGQISSSKITDGTIIGYIDLADASVTGAKLQYRYTFGFCVPFSVAAGGHTDVTVNATYGAVPVYVATIMTDASSNVDYGASLHLSIVNVTATQCVFRIHNTGGSNIDGVRIGWFVVGS